MQFTAMSVDYDGSLRNPVVVVALVVWATWLASLAFLVSYRLSAGRWRWLAAVPLLVLAALRSSAIQERYAAFILSAPTFTADVGFFGRPPALPAQIAALAGLTLGVLLHRRQARRWPPGASLPSPKKNVSEQI
jgi:hypothetical protein